MKKVSAKNVIVFVKRIAPIVEIASTIIAILSLIISCYAYQNSSNTLFYSRIEQSLTYSYEFKEQKDDLQVFENYEIPSILCTVHVSTGFPTRIAIINYDSEMENMHDMITKTGIEPITDSSYRFSLPFTSIYEYENVPYQYIFVYIEGVGGTWDLDCLIFEYNLEQNTVQPTMFDEIDMLRLDFIENDLDTKIITEYKDLYQKISEIKEK